MKFKKNRGLGKVIFCRWNVRAPAGPMQKTAAVVTLTERAGFMGLSSECT